MNKIKNRENLVDPLNQIRLYISQVIMAAEAVVFIKLNLVKSAGRKTKCSILCRKVGWYLKPSQKNFASLEKLLLTVGKAVYTVIFMQYSTQERHRTFILKHKFIHS